MKKMLPVAVIAMFAALSFSSCVKTTDNPEGVFTCTCVFSDSLSIDSTSTVYSREKLNQATTQCAATQTEYQKIAVPGEKVICSLNR